MHTESPPLEIPMPPSQITVVVCGYQFSLLAPYSEGQPLGLAEAGVLNREWTQAVRTGFQEKIKSQVEAQGGQLDHQQIAAIQLDFQHFADEFSFKALSQTRNSDPLLRAKYSIAKKLLDIRLNANGLTRQTYGEHKYEAALARLMNNHEVVAQAQATLESTREAADQIAGIMEQQA